MLAAMSKFTHNKASLSTVSFFLFLLASALMVGEAYAHGMSEAEKQAIIDGGNLAYLMLGATHMLSGYDHLAFVFGIVFFLTNFRDIVKYVTAFTIGHSITLIFATLNGIKLNYYLVEPIIALSVCYIAFHNIDGFRKYLKVEPPNMLMMIVGLGLIHGFGLSTRLQELPLSDDGLLMNIISFNVGIELGQVLALAAMLGVLALFRKSEYFAPFKLIANYFLIFWGGLLFLMQMHELEHSTANEPSAVADTGTGTSTATSGAGTSPGTSPLPITEQTAWKEEIKVPIRARGEIEYKFRLKKGAKLQYAWQTDGEKLFFDFHGEPKGDTTGYFKSYKESTKSKSSGFLTAPFEGTHGWYWKNQSSKPVIVTLKVKGEYERMDKKKVAFPERENLFKKPK